MILHHDAFRRRWGDDWDGSNCIISYHMQGVLELVLRYHDIFNYNRLSPRSINRYSIDIVYLAQHFALYFNSRQVP